MVADVGEKVTPATAHHDDASMQHDGHAKPDAVTEVEAKVAKAS